MVHSGHTVYGRFPQSVYQYKAPPTLAISQHFYETDPRNDRPREPVTIDGVELG